MLDVHVQGCPRQMLCARCGSQRSLHRSPCCGMPTMHLGGATSWHALGHHAQPSGGLYTLIWPGLQSLRNTPPDHPPCFALPCCRPLVPCSLVSRRA